MLSESCAWFTWRTHFELCRRAHALFTSKACRIELRLLLQRLLDMTASECMATQPTPSAAPVPERIIRSASTFYLVHACLLQGFEPLAVLAGMKSKCGTAKEVHELAVLHLLFCPALPDWELISDSCWRMLEVAASRACMVRRSCPGLPRLIHTLLSRVLCQQRLQVLRPVASSCLAVPLLVNFGLFLGRVSLLHSSRKAGHWRSGLNRPPGGPGGRRGCRPAA